MSLVTHLREVQPTTDEIQAGKLIAKCDSLLSHSASLLHLPPQN